MKILTIDNFKTTALNYLISHAHYDHIKGYDKYKGGIIVGSHITIEVLKLYNKNILDIFLRKIGEGSTYYFANGGGDIELKVFDANHCPGALMFYFRTRDNNILYTGDFRLNKKIEDIALTLRGIDIAYIDNTYNSKFYTFMSQESAIIEILDIIRKNLGKKIYIGLYTLGKNKIIKAVYEHLKLRTYVDGFNANIFKIIGLEKTITPYKENTFLYGVDLRELWSKMYGKQEEPNSIYILPTGWVRAGRTIRNIYYLVPYSEHCDYYELQRFLNILRPKQYYPLHYFKGF